MYETDAVYKTTQRACEKTSMWAGYMVRQTTNNNKTGTVYIG